MAQIATKTTATDRSALRTMVRALLRWDGVVLSFSLTLSPARGSCPFCIYFTEVSSNFHPANTLWSAKDGEENEGYPLVCQNERISVFRFSYRFFVTYSWLPLLPKGKKPKAERCAEYGWIPAKAYHWLYHWALQRGACKLHRYLSKQIKIREEAACEIVPRADLDTGASEKLN